MFTCWGAPLDAGALYLLMLEVPLGLGGAGVTLGGSGDHILVGVVVAHIRLGLNQFFRAWTSPIFH